MINVVEFYIRIRHVYTQPDRLIYLGFLSLFILLVLLIKILKNAISGIIITLTVADTFSLAFTKCLPYEIFLKNYVL